MNRRSFLAAALAATLDPEKLLWVPGRKLISIPKRQPGIFTYSGWQIGVSDDFVLSKAVVCGICLEHEKDLVAKVYARNAKFALLPYEGNEIRYHRLRDVQHTHYIPPSADCEIPVRLHSRSTRPI